MNLLITSLGYLKWHYGRALSKTFELWKNVLFFLFYFFSIKSLVSNFFTPWRRLAENYPPGFNIKAYASTFFVNTIMRIVGMILRTVVIVVGLACIALYVITLPLSLIVWLLLPPFIVFIMIYGLVLILFS